MNGKALFHSRSATNPATGLRSLSTGADRLRRAKVIVNVGSDAVKSRGQEVAEERCEAT